MSDVKQIVPLQLKSGFQRDGTQLDVKEAQFLDGEWCRFQQGRPRKMGGYVRISDRVNAPVRSAVVVPYNATARILSFSISGIQSLFLDENGVGTYLNDRTPTGFVKNKNWMWSTAQMYDDAVGADQSIILAVPTQTVNAVDSVLTGQVYYGNAFNETEAFEPVPDLTCRGLFVTEPYAVYYGPNGSVTWSNTNEPLNTTTGEAGSDRVTRSSFVAGLPLPSGTGPGGLLWSLDSVIRMEYVGGQAIFRFTKLTTSSSIISQNSVVELDGIYYWLGVDKWYVCDGQTVTELPNNSNRNWFFNNLHYDSRAKIWAERNTSFGEVIWHFPSGDSEECDAAIVYNTKEKCWYDYSVSRTAGTNYNQFPMLYSLPSKNKCEVTLDAVTGAFSVDDEITVFSKNARYRIDVIEDGVYQLTKTATSAEDIEAGDVIVNETQTGQAYIDTLSFQCALFKHEFGEDRVEGDFFYAIPSSFTTMNVSLLPQNLWTRLIRVEPDFVQNGDMQLEVITKEFPNSSPVSAGTYTYSNTTDKVDMRVQGRIIFLKFSSNTNYGFFHMGKPMIHVEAGDPRS